MSLCSVDSHNRSAKCRRFLVCTASWYHSTFALELCVLSMLWWSLLANLWVRKKNSPRDFSSRFFIKSKKSSLLIDLFPGSTGCFVFVGWICWRLDSSRRSLSWLGIFFTEGISPDQSSYRKIVHVSLWCWQSQQICHVQTFSGLYRIMISVGYPLGAKEEIAARFFESFFC